jgi:hypothetical protein
MPVKCLNVHEIADLCRTSTRGERLPAVGMHGCVGAHSAQRRSGLACSAGCLGGQAQRGGGGLQPAPRRAKRSAAARQSTDARRVETEGLDAQHERRDPAIRRGTHWPR